MSFKTVLDNAANESVTKSYLQSMLFKAVPSVRVMVVCNANMNKV